MMAVRMVYLMTFSNILLFWCIVHAGGLEYVIINDVSENLWFTIISYWLHPLQNLVMWSNGIDKIR